MRQAPRQHPGHVPAAGIRPDGKIVKARRLPFTGIDLATILKPWPFSTAALR
jgi:hypothetical protein